MREAWYRRIIEKYDLWDDLEEDLERIQVLVVTKCRSVK